MTGKESLLRKLNKSSLRRAQVCTRWRCCVDGCRDCLVTAFGSRCGVRLDAGPPSRCGFPFEHDSRLKEIAFSQFRTTLQEAKAGETVRVLSNGDRTAGRTERWKMLRRNLRSFPVSGRIEFETIRN